MINGATPNYSAERNHYPPGTGTGNIQDSHPPQESSSLSQFGSSNGYHYGQAHNSSSAQNNFRSHYPRSHPHSRHFHQGDVGRNSKTGASTMTSDFGNFTDGLSTAIVDGMPYMENSNVYNDPNVNHHSSSSQDPMNMDSAASRATSNSQMEETTQHTLDDDDYSINTRMSMQPHQRHPGNNTTYPHSWNTNSDHDGGPTASSSASDIFRGPQLEPILSPGRMSLTNGTTHTSNSHNGDGVSHKQVIGAMNGKEGDHHDHHHDGHHHHQPISNERPGTGSMSARADASAGEALGAEAPSHQPAPHIPAPSPYSHLYPHPPAPIPPPGTAGHYPYYGYPYYGPPPPHPHAPPSVPPPSHPQAPGARTSSDSVKDVERASARIDTVEDANATEARAAALVTDSNSNTAGSSQAPPPHALYPHWPYPYPHHPPYGVSMGLGHFYPPPPPYYPPPHGPGHAPPPYGSNGAAAPETSSSPTAKGGHEPSAPASPTQKALSAPPVLPDNKNLLSPKQPPSKKRKSIIRRGAKSYGSQSNLAISPSICEEEESNHDVNVIDQSGHDDYDSLSNSCHEIKRTGSSIITDAAASLSLSSSMDAGDSKNSYATFSSFSASSRGPRCRTSSEGSWKPNKLNEVAAKSATTGSPPKKSKPAPLPIPPSTKKATKTGRARSPGRLRILTSSPLELERKSTITTSNTSSTRSASTSSTTASVSTTASAPVPRARSRSKSGSNSTVSSRRDRKNALSRRRASRLKEEIAEIKARPPHERTAEETAKLEAYEDRRLRKNQISRDRALEKKARFEKITARDASTWTQEEKKFVEETSKAKLRKNEGDRARRRRMKKDNDDRSISNQFYGSFDDSVSTSFSNSISGSRSWGGGDDYSVYEGAEAARLAPTSNSAFPSMVGTMGGRSSMMGHYGAHLGHHNPDAHCQPAHPPIQEHFEHNGREHSFQNMPHQQVGSVEPLPLHPPRDHNAMDTSDNFTNTPRPHHPSDHFSMGQQGFDGNDDGKNVFNASNMYTGAILSPKVDESRHQVEPIPHHQAFQDHRRGVPRYTQSPTMELCAGSSILDASLNEIAFSPSSRTVGTSNASNAFSNNNAEHSDLMSAPPELSHINSPLKLPPLNLPRRPTRSMDDSQSFYDTIPPETKGPKTTENYRERQYSSSQKSGNGRQHGDAIAVSFSVDTV